MASGKYLVEVGVCVAIFVKTLAPVWYPKICGCIQLCVEPLPNVDQFEHPLMHGFPCSDQAKWESKKSMGNHEPIDLMCILEWMNIRNCQQSLDVLAGKPPPDCAKEAARQTKCTLLWILVGVKNPIYRPVWSYSSTSIPYIYIYIHLYKYIL